MEADKSPDDGLMHVAFFDNRRDPNVHAIAWAASRLQAPGVKLHAILATAREVPGVAMDVNLLGWNLPRPARCLHEGLRRLATGPGRMYLVKPLLHLILPATIRKLVLIDTDIVIVRPVAGLWAQFERFGSGAVVGMSYDFHERFPPKSNMSFVTRNGGVQLLNLKAMRASAEYNRLLDHHASGRAVRSAARACGRGAGGVRAQTPARNSRCHVRSSQGRRIGYLGDQTLYSFIASAKPHLVHRLGCEWNRQLNLVKNGLESPRKLLCAGGCSAVHANFAPLKCVAHMLNGAPDCKTWAAFRSGIPTSTTCPPKSFNERQREILRLSLDKFFGDCCDRTYDASAHRRPASQAGSGKKAGGVFDRHGTPVHVGRSAGSERGQGLVFLLQRCSKAFCAQNCGNPLKPNYKNCPGVLNKGFKTKCNCRTCRVGPCAKASMLDKVRTATALPANEMGTQDLCADHQPSLPLRLPLRAMRANPTATEGLRRLGCNSEPTPAWWHAPEPLSVYEGIVRTPAPHNGFGLGRELQLLLTAMKGAQVNEAKAVYRLELPNGRQIHLEHLMQPFSHHGGDSYIVNHERLYARDVMLLNLAAVNYNRNISVLCKNTICRHVMKAIMPSFPVRVFKFESFIERPSSAGVASIALHAAGKSSNRNTLAVVGAWRKHPEFPLLVVECRAECLSLKVAALLQDPPKNILHIDQPMDESLLRRLSEIAGLVVMPSACQGFGHTTHEGKARGHVVLYTDVYPINEGFDETLGIPVPPTAFYPIGSENSTDAGLRIHKVGKLRLSEEAGRAGAGCYVVSEEGVAHAVHVFLRRSAQEVRAMEQRAHESWRRDAARVMSRLICLDTRKQYASAFEAARGTNGLGAAGCDGVVAKAKRFVGKKKKKRGAGAMRDRYAFDLEVA
jgi:hypothetical protein